MPAPYYFPGTTPLSEFHLNGEIERMTNPFDSRDTLDLSTGSATIYRLDALAKAGITELD